MNEGKPTILAIESSCDDTSAAVLRGTQVLSNVVANQKVHEQYGGVVPELASRAHQQHIVPVVKAALEEAGVQRHELNAVAFTRGPGLMGSLLVGASFAKGIALGLGIPLLAVDHMKGHVLAHFIQAEENTPTPDFPFLCLTVSGGHSQLVLVKDHLDMEVVGKTLDDAAGEAFDKAGKILGLPYPAGPVIDRLAKEGDSNRFKISLPKTGSYEFSFSGIKSSFLFLLQRECANNADFVQENLADLCASIQHTIVEHLMRKFRNAATEMSVQDLAICGGVSANSHLREQVKELGRELGKRVFIPPFEYCTDNAAMIAITAQYQFLSNDLADQSTKPLARSW